MCYPAVAARSHPGDSPSFPPPATNRSAPGGDARRIARRTCAPSSAPERLIVASTGNGDCGSSVRVQEEWEPQPLSETIGSVDDDYELADQRFTLEAACRKLPVRERLVLHMRFIEDRTQTDIAATIGLSPMQVSRILRGAIERLELAARPELEC